MSKKVKSIIFELELEGRGIVNYDSTDQKNIFWADAKNGKHRLLSDVEGGKSNYNFAKKTFFRDEKGNLDYKIKISSDSLRHSLYSKSAVSYIGNIAHNPNIKFSFIASPMGLTRGYMLTNGKGSESHKRKSAFTIGDAIQTNNSLSTMELFSKSGIKEDTSLFKKETIGDITYKTNGFIDVAQLQFISADPLYDRKAFDSDEYPYFNKFYKLNFNKEEDAKLGYYLLNNTNVEIGEYGVKMDDDVVISNIKYILKNLLGLNIRRTKAYCQTKALRIKLIENPLDDSLNGEWLTITSEKQIDDLDFEIEQFYIETTGDFRQEYRELIEKELEDKQATKRADKTTKVKSRKTKKEVDEVPEA